MRIVVALGGNALLKRGEPMTHDVQRANIQVAAQALAPVAKSTSSCWRMAMVRRWACWRFRLRPTKMLRPIRWMCWERKPRA